MVDIVPDSATPPPAPKSKSSVEHVDALRPGTRLAEFEVRGLLGVGGFGLVYRAYDTSLQRMVAIKEYMPAALAGRLNGQAVSVRSSGDQGTYASGLQSFIAEARLLAKFDHPSLVKVFRFWEGNNTAYMVMPLYSGMTLSQARSQMTGPPAEEWLRTVLWSILQGLHVLHRSDTLHRDVSPDNIFLQDVGPPVLLDLGAARRAITDKDHKRTAVLKVNFAPIEQYAEAEDLKQGPWTDLYALAGVVYTCLRNDPPLPATARVVRDSMPSVRSVAAAVKEHFGIEYSDRFVRAITHALAVQPADRPQSLAAFVTEMKLKAPPRLSKFDWRAELGGGRPSERDENHSRQFWSTQPQTLPDAERRDRAGRMIRYLGWVAGVALAAASLWGLVEVFTRLASDAPPMVAAPEPAAMPVVPPAPAASEPLPTPVPVGDGGVPSVSPGAGEVDAVRRPPTDRKPPPTAVNAPASQPPVAAEKERKSASGVAAKAGGSEQKSTPKSQDSVSTPESVCASANFFARPLCIHEECKKPVHAQRQVCIEDRERNQNRAPASP